MMNKAMSQPRNRSHQDQPAKRPEAAVQQVTPRQVSWNDIGETFETMGKIGLAMAVGMSAAGLFCRLAEQGKVKVPTLSGLVLNRNAQTAVNEARSNNA